MEDGGSVPASVRNAFLDLLDDGTGGPAECALARQLLGCSDVLPVEYCQMLGLPEGTTFDLAARRVGVIFGCGE